MVAAAAAASGASEKAAPCRLCVACHNYRVEEEFSKNQWKKSTLRVCRACRDFENKSIDRNDKAMTQPSDFFKATLPCMCCRGRGHGLSDATKNMPCRLCLATGRVLSCPTCAGQGKLKVHAAKDGSSSSDDDDNDEKPPDILSSPEWCLCPQCSGLGEVSPALGSSSGVKQFAPRSEEDVKAEADKRQAELDRKTKAKADAEARQKSKAAKLSAAMQALGWPADITTINTFKELFALAKPQADAPGAIHLDGNNTWNSLSAHFDNAGIFKEHMRWDFGGDYDGSNVDIGIWAHNPNGGKEDIYMLYAEVYTQTCADSKEAKGPGFESWGKLRMSTYKDYMKSCLRNFSEGKTVKPIPATKGKPFASLGKYAALAE